MLCKDVKTLSKDAVLKGFAQIIQPRNIKMYRRQIKKKLVGYIFEFFLK